jgi:plastocyanin
VLIVGAFLGLLIGGNGAATAANAPGTSSDPPTVHITAAGVNPTMVQVEPGQTVVWINESGAKRSVVADDSSFDSGSLASGDRFQFAFTEPGTVTYSIVSAPGVKGTVVVSAATPAATPAPAPTGTPPTAPTDFAYTGAGSALTGAAGAFALALGVGLVLSARRIGLMAYSGLSYFLAPDDLLPTRRQRRVRRNRARKGL